MAMSAIGILGIAFLSGAANLFLLVKHRRMIRISKLLLGLGAYAIVAANYCYAYSLAEAAIGGVVEDAELLAFGLIPLLPILIGAGVFQRPKALALYLLIHTGVLTLPLVALDKNGWFDSILTVFFSLPVVVLVVGGAFLYDMIGIAAISAAAGREAGRRMEQQDAMERRMKNALLQWGFEETALLRQYEAGGGRTVCKMQTESGPVVVKGQPLAAPEDSVMGTIHAHEFLGNKHGLAPRLLHRPDGSSLWRDEESYYFIMEYVEGRQPEENGADERLLGRALARLHKLGGYDRPCPFDTNQDIARFKSWYADKPWKADFDRLVDGIPDFTRHDQCLIHTDMGPHNSLIRDGAVIFLDLDDTGIGPRHIDVGWPFIAQFVDYDKKTKAICYKPEAAKAFLKGYCSVLPLRDRADYDLLWWGAVYSHIYNMQWYGPEAADSLWAILNYGLEQKDGLLELVGGGVMAE